ncbi:MULTISPECIES: hypothetical protein [Bacillaceae]|uniref:Uncharacterized protein n=1 Tax=Evansella alkalicola TaxID=745819 RepID=A0ABS6JV88_9BACI|nr:MULTISPECIES: hypothetical protein [Bacillaceae]MBU9722503.1 hypothetical protein [Bacillus alkalicola]
MFDLIANNPLLLFFVIAALLSFFQGMGGKKQEEKSRGPRPGQPTTSQGQEEVDWREIFRQEHAPTEHDNENQRPSPSNTSMGENSSTSLNTASRETEIEKANRELQERYEKVKKKKAKAIERLEKSQGSPILSNDITKSPNTKVQLDFKNISREEAIKGIIWAEVLGKPKAKRAR